MFPGSLFDIKSPAVSSYRLSFTIAVPEKPELGAEQQEEKVGLVGPIGECLGSEPSQSGSKQMSTRGSLCGGQRGIFSNFQ